MFKNAKGIIRSSILKNDRQYTITKRKRTLPKNKKHNKKKQKKPKKNHTIE